MSYLLLTDPNRCPACNFRNNLRHFRPCQSCGVMLFQREIDFKTWEADGNTRSYWLFTGDRGWIHRDYVMRPDADPQRFEAEIETPPADYGRHTTPEEISRKARRRRLTPA